MTVIDSRTLPRSRTVLANQAWEAALTAHAVLMRRFAAEDVWHGLSMREYDVLYTLSKCDAPQRISDLGRHVLLSQPGLSRLVERLVERDLLTRCADPGDARASHISLTTAGRAIQRKIGLAHGEAVAHSLTAALSDEELHALENLSTKLAQEAP
ncbi:MarR family winged helix-turn-helix transcriptional regulator [Demequina aestuarii]|uniref:MarR family winged helix-turn-helix transcriptional regulator n=1 Tax=Demequina aestuarii TaxID=327095 RepID=UPI00078540DF|nr:MarR family winged helix-turn-helix transcriptional regulator [Demequina aestuarii]